jgi:hypothetical protein
MNVNLRRTLLAGGLTLGVLGVVAPILVVAQAPPKASTGADKAGPKKFVAKRLPWGDPDLQGNFTTKDEANTPFERPPQFAGKRAEDVTPAELAAANEVRRREALAAAPYPGGGSRTQGVAIAVPIHWFDSLDSQNSRPWFVIDPPDGKVPPLTEEAKKRQAEALAARRGRGTADSYTDRSLGDRCVGFGIPAARPLPTLYGNSIQVLQTKDYVAIRYEMIHETRIIPIDGRGNARPHASPNLRSYYGDAIAHWDGDTLVVDTTNFNGKFGFRGSGEKLHLTERLTRVAPDKIDWRATLDDPTTWTAPWTFGLPWTEDDSQPIFEYACHEGNYGLRNILSAGRSDDKKGIKSSDAVDDQGDLEVIQ